MPEEGDQAIERIDEGLSMNNDDTEGTDYKVVVNDEQQFSIWAADRPNPNGWRDTPKSGSKSECLAYIKEVWTDMRPLSLRNRMNNSLGLPEPSGVHLNRNHRKASERKS
jgi:MbtH protein